MTWDILNVGKPAASTNAATKFCYVDTGSLIATDETASKTDVANLNTDLATLANVN